MNRIHFLNFVLLIFLSCQKDEERQIDSSYQPDINPAKFTNSTALTNPYFPAPIDKTYRYEGQSEDGTEAVEEKRQATSKTVDGIECVVIKFTAWLNGQLSEEADDWYAQDTSGTVWYFGEYVNNYDSNGQLINHDGSWEAGVDGAKPGIIMPANPTPGMQYREEYYFNEAEDQAEIVNVGLMVSIPYGNFTNVLETRNWSELEPDIVEQKFYAPGIGVIRELSPMESEELNLVSIQ
jgi:hypothetical protein